EPDETHGALNPFHHPAQENVALLLLDAHRLLDDDPRRGAGRFQSAVLEQIPVYRKLFRDAFPAEAAAAPGCIPETAPARGACDNLINTLTIVRATATFMRTVVTRNTPWDLSLMRVEYEIRRLLCWIRSSRTRRPSPLRWSIRRC